MFTNKISDSKARNKIPFLIYCRAMMVDVIVKLLGSTYKLKIVEGEDLLENILKEKSPMIICAWHNRIYYLKTFIAKYMLPRGFKLTQMSSLSKDGDIGSLIGKWAGVTVVRGSPTKRGARGLIELIRAVKERNDSVILLPDGSKGPVYEAKAGSVILAQLTGVPIYCFSYDVDCCWRVKSWDRMVIPKPFAKITFRISGPDYFERKMSKEQLEQSRLKLEANLNKIKMMD